MVLKRFDLKFVGFQIKQFVNVDIGMTKEDVKKVGRSPRAQDQCSVGPRLENYGSVWVVFSSGTVVAIINARDWSGACYPLYVYKDKS